MSFVIAILIAVVPAIVFLYCQPTPIELFTNGQKEECMWELSKMYKAEDDAQRRFVDIQDTLEITDKYTVSIVRFAFCPWDYRRALAIGVGVGLSQGIIDAFFKNYLCHIMNSNPGFAYCEKQIYSVNSDFTYLIFLNVLAIGPTIFFLSFLERLSPSSSIDYGRVRLFIFGMISTFSILLLMQLFIGISKYAPWSGYVSQGLLLFYTIIVYSATLGPV